MINPGRSDLLAWWPMDEVSGDAIDVHNGYDLTDVGSVGSATGKVGGARSFNGSSQYLTRASESAFQFDDDPFTMGGWLLVNSLPSFQVVMGKVGSAAPFEHWLRVASGEWQYLISADSSSFSVLHGTPYISTSLWYFWIIRHDPVANMVSLQINNGTRGFGTHSGGVFSGSGAWRLGASINPNHYLNGRQDEVFIYRNRILTLDEGEWLYNNGDGRAYDELSTGSGFAVIETGGVAVPRAVSYRVFASSVPRTTFISNDEE